MDGPGVGGARAPMPESRQPWDGYNCGCCLLERSLYAKQNTGKKRPPRTTSVPEALSFSATRAGALRPAERHGWRFCLQRAKVARQEDEA